MTYALTRSFSHASYGIGHAPLSHIAAYAPVTGVPNPLSACGTCPFKARLFIMGLTSVVCHILSCSVETHMTARDVRVTRQPKGVIMKHSTRKSTLFEPIILPRQSETSSHCVKEGSADVFRSTWRPFCSKHGHVTRTSCDLLPVKTKWRCTYKNTVW